MSKEEVQVEQHESYGIVGLSRVTCGAAGGGINLFGSSIRQSEVIALRLATARVQREVGRNWYSADKHIIEVYLSPNQFAELVTHMNVGEGVPCTITRHQGRMMQPCPEYNQGEKFERDFRNDVLRIMQRTHDLIADVKARFDKKNVGATDKKAILDELAMIQQDIEQNLPYVHSTFREAMDKTATEAKAAVEAFVENKIRSAGLDALQGRPVIALPETKHVEAKVLPQLPEDGS